MDEVEVVGPLNIGKLPGSGMARIAVYYELAECQADCPMRVDLSRQLQLQVYMYTRHACVQSQHHS